MNIKQIGRKWQKLLGLEHWKVNCKFTDPLTDSEFDDGAEGYVHINHNTQVASIVVNKNTICPIEAVVAHEMLHILIRERMLPLSALIESVDAEKIYDFVDERLTQALEVAFMAVGGE